MQADGVAHAAFALAALVLGGWVLSRPKGTEAHRAVGMLYVLSSFSVNVTALTIYRGDGTFGVFHALAVVNLTVLLTGFSSAFLRRPRNTWIRYHYYFMGWSYVGLCAAAGAEAGVRIPGASFLPGVAVPTVLITLVGGSWVQRSARATISRVARAADVGRA